VTLGLRNSGDVSVIALSGEFDVYSSRAVKDELDSLFKSGRKGVVVNLERVTSIDATAIGVLIGALSRARPLGGSLSIVTGAPRMKRLFQGLGLLKAISLFEKEEDAVAAFAAESGAGAA
jgi:anti-anti-sigma factor